MIKKIIFWDFDGVLMNSNFVRDKGFELVLSNFPKEEVSKLMDFHRANGGWSRYVKFRHFFEEIRNESVSASKINEFAMKFSEVMLQELINPKLLIQDSMSFVTKHQDKYSMHIVSGSDGNELNKICDGVGIKKLFKSINGSPTPKINLVKDIITLEGYDPEECLLIGDSINDYEAAMANSIDFYGYNNPKLNEVGLNYIQSFESFHL